MRGIEFLGVSENSENIRKVNYQSNYKNYFESSVI